MHQPLVEIRKPCHESLDPKKPGAQGNYCKSCQLTVTDFTRMNPEEISNHLMHHPVHCGTFNRKDVSTGGFSQKLIAFLHARHLKIAAVVLSSLLLLVSCRVRRGKVQGAVRWTDKNNPSIENLK